MQIYTEEEIVDALCEAIWECEREPTTKLWDSFWDRLNVGWPYPAMPEPPVTSERR